MCGRSGKYISRYGRVRPNTLKWVIMYSSVTFYTNVQQNDRLALGLFTATGEGVISLICSIAFHCGSTTVTVPSRHWFDMTLDVGCLDVFYVPSTARSFGDGTPIYCSLPRTWSSVFTPFPPAWQSSTLPLRHATSTNPSLMLKRRTIKESNQFRFQRRTDYGELTPTDESVHHMMIFRVLLSE